MAADLSLLSSCCQCVLEARVLLVACVFMLPVFSCCPRGRRGLLGQAHRLHRPLHLAALGVQNLVLEGRPPSPARPGADPGNKTSRGAPGEAGPKIAFSNLTKGGGSSSCNPPLSAAKFDVTLEQEPCVQVDVQ